MDDLVVGDIVHLSAGDMIPADVRILDAKDLLSARQALPEKVNRLKSSLM